MRNLLSHQGQWYTFFAVVLCMFALSFIYLADISVNWGYMGFERHVSAVRLAIGAVVTLLFMALCPRADDTRSVFLKFSIYAYLIPACILFALAGFGVGYMSSVVLAFIVLFGVSALRVPRLKVRGVSGRYILGIAIGLSVVAVAAMMAYGGLSRFNLDIFRVYDYRRDAAVGLPALFGYLVSPVSKVVIPVGVVLGLFYRSPISVFSFLGLTVIFFGMTHHKSVLVAPFFVLAIYFIMQRWRASRVVDLFFAAAVLVVLVEFVVVFFFVYNEGGGVLSSLVARRLFFVPPLIDNYYVEFFSVNPKMYWSGSRLSLGLVEASYNTTAPFVIGQEYFGKHDVSANSGIVASGFANAGYVGVVLYAAILGIIISVLDSHGRHLGHPLIICSSLVLFLTILTTSDLITTLLTHGLLLLMLALPAFPKPRVKGIRNV